MFIVCLSEYVENQHLAETAYLNVISFVNLRYIMDILSLIGRDSEIFNEDINDFSTDNRVFIEPKSKNLPFDFFANKILNMRFSDAW